MATGKILYDLVQSLSANEKRHFKLKGSIQGGNKNYTLLFDALDALEEYDKEQLLCALENLPFTKDLHVTENYLFNRILESLRAFHEEKSSEAQMYNLLLNATLLKKKGFYDLSAKTLAKAKKLAIQTQNNHLLIEILKRQLRNTAATQTQKLVEQTDLLSEELHTTGKLLNEELDYFSLNQASFVRYRKWKLAKKEDQKQYIKDLLHDKKMQAFPEKGSFLSQYLYYNIKNNCYSLAGNYEAACAEAEKNIQLWEEYPILKNEKKSLYIIQLSNLINQKNKLLNFETIPSLLEKLEQIKSTTEDEKAELFQNIYFQKLCLCLNQMQLNEGQELVPTISSGLEKYKSKINRARELAFYINITILFFLDHKYDEAIYWLHKIQNIKRTNEPRMDIQRFSRILQLAIYYKIGSYEVLEHMFRSIYRKKNLVASLHDFEQIVLNYFKKLLQTPPNSKEEKEIFRCLKGDLLELPENNKRVLGFEELLIWIEDYL